MRRILKNKRWIYTLTALAFVGLLLGSSFHFHETTAPETAASDCTLCHSAGSLKWEAPVAAPQIFVPEFSSGVPLIISSAVSVQKIGTPQSRGPPSPLS